MLSWNGFRPNANETSWIGYRDPLPPESRCLGVLFRVLVVASFRLVTVPLEQQSQGDGEGA